MPIDETRAFRPVRIALLTVSDTRTLAEDKSGDILADRIALAGHILAERALLKDDAADIVALLHRWVDDAMIDCVIVTGGTGLTGRDVTPEALAQPAFGRSGQHAPARQFARREGQRKRQSDRSASSRIGSHAAEHTRT